MAERVGDDGDVATVGVVGRAGVESGVGVDE